MEVVFKKSTLAVIKSAIAELHASGEITRLMKTYGFPLVPNPPYAKKINFVNAYLDGVDWSVPENSENLVELLAQLFLQFGHLIQLGKQGESSNPIYAMTTLENALLSAGLVWNGHEFQNKKDAKAAPLEGSDTIWEPGCLRAFISHKDSRKVQAHALAESLTTIGVSGFVAHDTIEPDQLWKNEIQRGLETMDAFIAVLSSDYYDSVWCNQEIGFALAKGVPIFLYSLDKTDPKGFQMDRQAIKTGEASLLHQIVRKFPDAPSVKSSAIKAFTDAIDGSFRNAKVQFMKLIGLKFTNDEIDSIVNAFRAKAKHTNQLTCLFTDGVLDEHAKILKGFEYYKDALEEVILSQHTRKQYRIVETGEYRYEIQD